jgi:hypothetical protein
VERIFQRLGPLEGLDLFSMPSFFARHAPFGLLESGTGNPEVRFACHTSRDGSHSARQIRMAVTYERNPCCSLYGLAGLGRLLQEDRIVGTRLAWLACQCDTGVAGQSTSAGAYGQLVDQAWVQPVH